MHISGSVVRPPILLLSLFTCLCICLWLKNCSLVRSNIWANYLLLTFIDRFAIFVHVCKFILCYAVSLPIVIWLFAPIYFANSANSQMALALRTLTWKLKCSSICLVFYFFARYQQQIAYPMSYILSVRVNWVCSWKFGWDYIISTLCIFKLAEIALDIEWKFCRDIFGQLKLSWTMRLRQKLPANCKWLNCSYDGQVHCGNLQSLCPVYLHKDTFVWYITSFVSGKVCIVYLMGCLSTPVKVVYLFVAEGLVLSNRLQKPP
jgi:hypothetical protein